MTNYRQYIDIDLVDSDRDGIAAAQQLGGAGNLVLAGALTSGGVYTANDTDDIPVGRQVGIYSGGNLSALTFTVYGTSPDDETLAEDVTGPNGGQVETTNYFRTVTRVAVDGAVGSDVEVGLVDELITKRIPIGITTGDFAVGIGVVVGGTINFTVQNTYDNIYATSPTITYFDISDLASKTANTAAGVTTPCTAVRLKVNSFTDTATIRINVLQNYR